MSEAFLQWLEWVGVNMDPDLKVFPGPCVHGRIPYTRCDECGELAPECARDKAQLAECRRVLRMVEPIFRGNGVSKVCPICKGNQPGHAPDCALVKALGES